MQSLYEIRLALWKEACRNIDVDVSLTRIAEILARALPLERIALFYYDPGIPRLERLSCAATASALDAPPATAITPLDPEALAAWCRERGVCMFPAAHPPAPLPFETTAGCRGLAAAAALCSEHGSLGVLMLDCAADAAFGDVERRLLGLLGEPMAVALENDRRLRELMTLREAAEADKRKLLSRLGRESLSDEIVGANGGLRSVLERVALVARSEVPVLILGETGSGKEVIARAVHDASPRREGPLIRVNCGAIPSELVDSELFGHERGSFTGAVGERRGWFERADGGTLFLDEIGELPTAAQVRLLRVLQEGAFERVGGERPMHVNVRIVAATHRDLAAMVRERRFREDLWYRLAVFPVALPALRERREDIPELARHFARRAARRFGLREQGPTAADIALLLAYDWPGNVRELASVMDRAAILGEGERLEVAKALGIAPAAGGAPDAQPGVGERAGDEPVARLDDAMRRHIERALIACRGKLEGPGGAARLLDINPHTLRARMRKLGIDWARYRPDGPG